MSFLVWLPKNVSSQELEEQRSEGVDLGVSYENLTSDPITEVKGKLMFVFAKACKESYKHSKVLDLVFRSLRTKGFRAYCVSTL